MKQLLFILSLFAATFSFEQEKRPIYQFVEQMPQSTVDINAYMAKNLHYPLEAKEKGVQGRVVVQFIVGETGKVEGAKVIRGIGSGCDEEALKAINGMPLWKPGKQNGKAVPVYYTMPVAFKLETANEPVGIDPGIVPAKQGANVPAPPPVFMYVEQMPSAAFDMNDYLSKNLHYPDSAKAAGVQGRVIVRFVVNEDGTLSDFTVQRGIGKGCDEEAVRVLKAMPPWKPGKQNGKAVKVYFTQPISFKLM